MQVSRHRHRAARADRKDAINLRKSNEPLQFPRGNVELYFLIWASKNANEMAIAADGARKSSSTNPIPSYLNDCQIFTQILRINLCI